jgi:hypothetical protein
VDDSNCDLGDLSHLSSDNAEGNNAEGEECDCRLGLKDGLLDIIGSALLRVIAGV